MLDGNDVDEILFIIPLAKGRYQEVSPLGNLTLTCLVSLFSCRSIGGMYGMGGWKVNIPFLHSESFRHLGMDLWVVLMAYCESRVSKKRCFNRLLGGTCKISHNLSAGNFVESKILNPWY
jgi:hypothetical protein